MPGTVSDGPSISMSFANNFWGKDDAGVHPLLERMHNAKVTCDELKSFYSTRAAIEDEYSRKLLSLCRKPLGSQEAGTLRISLDVMRGEVESMGKAHQSIAAQMKSELEEPLAAFAGGMKERRKIVQSGVEKLLKVKVQQTHAVNKTRDRYEQDCLRIKGYLAQGHMVMGQEERKNKAKLEKTQIQLATTSNEYEAAVKVLEETTGRWNRDWKAACDKFQDLEEERLDFTKSSLWSFANIASTVCVSDDASCEKIRLSLEGCEVEKDINSFIQGKGTGQEIPDPPKYINFCRGDINDTSSEASEDDNYSVAQFQRTINPAFRSSSPQPSTYESHHDPQSILAAQLSHQDPHTPPSRETTMTPQTAAQPPMRPPQLDYQRKSPAEYQRAQAKSMGAVPSVPHNEYPMDGMTMYCRAGPPSERSSAASPARPSSRDSQSEYSNPTSFSSQEPPSGKQSPVKQGGLGQNATVEDERVVQKKKSGFFQSHSPFRRKSKHDKDGREQSQPSGGMALPGSRNTWGPSSGRSGNGSAGTAERRSQMYTEDPRSMILGGDRRSGSPEPVDPRANFQLNVGNNVFDVASPDKQGKKKQDGQGSSQEQLDPIAQALEELKGVTKQSSVRMSADRYHGLATPAPPSTPGAGAVPTPMANGALASAQRGTPPPSYEQPVKRLDLPQAAFTSAQMQQTTRKYTNQTQNMFNPASRNAKPYDAGSQPRQAKRGSGQNQEVIRATSPAPPRSTSPRPSVYGEQRQKFRSASPNPYSGSGRPRAQSSSPVKRSSEQSYSYSRRGSPATEAPRAVSPQPQLQFRQPERPGSSAGAMQLQLAPGPEVAQYGGDQGARQPRTGGGAMSYYGGGQDGNYAVSQAGRVRSKSVADARQYTRDGRPIIHFARALYMYQAAIPEELSFSKGDTLAVLRLQDDGWWEAETAVNKAPAFDNPKRDAINSTSIERQGLLMESSDEERPGAYDVLTNALVPFRAATSKPAQRAYISTILLFITSFVLLGLAIVAYTLFYFNYIPQVGLERVVHLQFREGSFPHGTVSHSAELVSEQPYDVTVSLHLPRTPSNLAAGNFMLDLSLLAPTSGSVLTSPTSTDVLAHSRRSGILTYASELVGTAHKLTGIPWFVLGWSKEAELLEVKMMEGVEFARGWRNIPSTTRLEIQSRETMQVYSAKVKFVARFYGLRWLMYNHRIISFFIFTTLFWFVEMISTAIAWLALAYAFSLPPVQPSVKEEPEKDSGEVKEENGLETPLTEDLSDTSRTFPTYSRQPPLRYSSPRVKYEDEDEDQEVEGTTAIQPLVGEAADDEDSMRNGRGGRSDSGLGSSMEESAGRREQVQRRRSRLFGGVGSEET
ncbi:MAG: hypothetical protein M1819_003921 [Sarea resinae]|nr:MAG: hypothetical protein M1819_003921 [Sarea resinae]